MAVSAAHCRLMAKVGEFADEQWKKDGPEIAGKRGFQAAHYQAVRYAHPPFPIYMYSIGLIPALSNGAKVDLWGAPDPLCLPVLNVNHSQSRKSRLTGLAEAVCGTIDAHVAKRLAQIFDAKVDAQSKIQAAKKRRTTAASAADGDGEGEPTGKEDSKTIPGVFPGMWSHACLGGTIERIQERCAGNFNVVKQTAPTQKLPALKPEWVKKELDCDAAEKEMAIRSGMRGRTWFGQGLVHDEIYGFLQDISILDKPQKGKEKQPSASGQTPLAGWFNRLVQSGRSDHETKTCGSHGGLDALPVSTTLLGNFHPTPAIEMLRGERGDHGCQAKARLIVCTGLPVQPHETYDDTENSTYAADWVDVPRAIWGDVGLANAFSSVNAFKAHFNRIGAAADGEEECEDEEEDGLQQNPEHVPNADGYSHELPDGARVCGGDISKYVACLTSHAGTPSRPPPPPAPVLPRSPPPPPPPDPPHPPPPPQHHHHHRHPSSS